MLFQILILLITKLAFKVHEKIVKAAYFTE